jgi:molybdopterin/thiamine biosynthesis adenylyltransferase
MERIAAARLFVCGAGAVGSLLVDNLLRQGVRHLAVIDDDRVEGHNVNTQLYGLEDVGAPKAQVLQAHAFRSVETEIEAHVARLAPENVRRLLRDVDLIVDTFDNRASRQLVRDHAAATGLPCLHVGLFEGYAEALWNERYRVPRDVAEGDVCDYPMARNLVVFAAAIASEVVIRFLVTGTREDRSFTLADMRTNDESR